MLKLLLFPILVAILLLFNVLTKVNLLLVVIGCLILFYTSDIFLKNTKKYFEVESKALSLIIALVFFGSIIFSVYYIWIK